MTQVTDGVETGCREHDWCRVDVKFFYDNGFSCVPRQQLFVEAENANRRVVWSTCVQGDAFIGYKKDGRYVSAMSMVDQLIATHGYRLIPESQCELPTRLYSLCSWWTCDVQPLTVLPE